MNTYSFIGFAEPFSALSHMFGALICALCTISLVFSKERACGVRLALGVFCFSCVLLLSMSGLFHLLPRDNSASSLLQRLDHAAIFILIAGTFTPIHYVKFKGFWCWAPLCVVWSVAVSGIVLKSVFFTEIPESVSLLS